MLKVAVGFIVPGGHDGFMIVGISSLLVVMVMCLAHCSVLGPEYGIIVLSKSKSTIWDLSHVQVLDPSRIWGWVLCSWCFLSSRCLCHWWHPIVWIIWCRENLKFVSVCYVLLTFAVWLLGHLCPTLLTLIRHLILLKIMFM